MSQNVIADELGVDIRQSAQVPDLVMAESFFNKLAEYGIVPETEDEQRKLWDCGELLSAHMAKTAAASRGETVLDRGLAMLQYGAKVASASAPAAQQELELAEEVSSKVAMYLENPDVFSHGLALFAENSKG